MAYVNLVAKVTSEKAVVPLICHILNNNLSSFILISFECNYHVFIRKYYQIIHQIKASYELNGIVAFLFESKGLEELGLLEWSGCLCFNNLADLDYVIDFDLRDNNLKENFNYDEYCQESLTKKPGKGEKTLSPKSGNQVCTNDKKKLPQDKKKINQTKNENDSLENLKQFNFCEKLSCLSKCENKSLSVLCGEKFKQIRPVNLMKVENTDLLFPSNNTRESIFATNGDGEIEEYLKFSDKEKKISEKTKIFFENYRKKFPDDASTSKVFEKSCKEVLLPPSNSKKYSTVVLGALLIDFMKDIYYN